MKREDMYKTSQGIDGWTINLEAFILKGYVLLSSCQLEVGITDTSDLSNPYIG